MILTTVSRQGWLALQFARREIVSRYAGGATGLAWTILHPLAQLAIFSFVFSQIFRAGVPPEFPGVSYTAFVAVALWPWLMFSESVQRGLGVIAANAGLIRKVALPTHVLVLAAVLACYAIHLAGFVCILVVLALAGERINLGGLPIAIVILAPYMLLACGIALALAALHTLLRDVEHVTSLLMTVLFYATPILYPITLIPAQWRDAARANPLSYLSERLRDALLGQPQPALNDLLVAAICGLVFVAGLWVFRRLSPYFEEFL